MRNRPGDRTVAFTLETPARTIPEFEVRGCRVERDGPLLRVTAAPLGTLSKSDIRKVIIAGRAYANIVDVVVNSDLVSVIIHEKD